MASSNEEAARSVQVQVLATLYDLTPVEANIYAPLLPRHTIAQAAACLGIAHGTVKTHLIRRFANTGTPPKAGLVGLGAPLSLAA